MAAYVKRRAVVMAVHVKRWAVVMAALVIILCLGGCARLGGTGQDGRYSAGAGESGKTGEHNSKNGGSGKDGTSGTGSAGTEKDGATGTGSSGAEEGGTIGSGSVGAEGDGASVTGSAETEKGGTRGGAGDGEEAFDEDSGFSVEKKNCLGLTHASQFRVDALEGGCYELVIRDGERFLLIPEGASLPKAEEAEGSRHTETSVDRGEGAALVKVEIPASNIYLAASSAMDMFRELDALERIRFTSTKDWAIADINEWLASDSMYYIGRYSAPDYEALLEGDCDLAIESTMITHSPRVKEELESLKIPVITERSSYEQDPLGRLEWIKLYGLLTGREKEATDFFAEACGEVDDISAANAGKGKSDGKDASGAGDGKSDGKDARGSGKKTVAFFAVAADGSITVRRPGDYVTKMISMAGGRYVPAGIPKDEKGTAPTMSLQAEAFVDQAAEADILIYNSTIEGTVTSVDELVERCGLLREFRAVKNRRVFCTKGSMFQETTGVARMIVELHDIIEGKGTADMTYFYRLR